MEQPISTLRGKLPDYFYPRWVGGNFAVDPRRWTDPFATDVGEERLVLTPGELRAKGERMRTYLAWLGKRRLKGKQCLFQAIQVMTKSNYGGIKSPWWENYQDAIFRVFVQPETVYDQFTKEHMQWYVLAPEDSELVLRHKMDKQGFPQAPRNALEGERWVSKNPRIRKALLIPVECSRHLRHEKTAGKLAIGL